MKRENLLALSLIFCLVGIMTGDALAFGSIGDSWNANYDTACQTLVDATLQANGCVLCHDAGFSLNPYGDTIGGFGVDWASIEGTDSDGDGRTNGEEILTDCTLPGDIASVPADGATWSAIKALYR